MDDEETREYLFKVLVVGDVGVGKTSLIRRYVCGAFASSYRVTIGVDFGLKEMVVGDAIVRAQLWDIAGQERFGNLTRVYYKEAVGALVVFDITSRESLELAGRWKADIDHKVFLPNGQRIPCLLLANKCDMPAQVTAAEVDSFAHTHGFVGWAATSAKTGQNVDDAAAALIQRILAIEAEGGAPPAPPPQEPGQSLQAFRSPEATAPRKRKCC